MGVNRTDPDSVNEDAVFHPFARSGMGRAYPAIEVGGVLVFVYVGDDGRLRVSLHYDTADLGVFPGAEVSGVPVDIAGTAGGDIVWSAG